jgi:hypothetical protein
MLYRNEIIKYSGLRLVYNEVFTARYGLGL